MMLTAISRFIPKKLALRSTTYQLSSIHRRNMASIVEKYGKKEKVEEDRFIRAQEQAWTEKLRQVRAEQESIHAQDLHSQIVDPVKTDIAQILRKSGDSVSDEALEALAKWKLGA